MGISVDGKNQLDKLKFRIDFDKEDSQRIIDMFVWYDTNVEDVKRYYDKGGYKVHIQSPNGRISLKDNHRSVMIEMNPLKYDIEHPSHFIITKLLYLAKKSIVDGQYCIEYKRIDIKQDHLEDLGDKDYSSNKRKEVTFKNGGVLETIYIGSRESEEMYRIYDKRKESKIDIELPIWRIEVELKGESIISQIIDGRNPFENLEIKNKQEISYTDLKMTNLTSAERNALWVYLTTNEPLKNLISKNKVSKCKQAIEDIEKMTTRFKVNQDIEVIRKELKDFPYTLDIERLINVCGGQN